MLVVVVANILVVRTSVCVDVDADSGCVLLAPVDEDLVSFEADVEAKVVPDALEVSLVTLVSPPSLASDVVSAVVSAALGLVLVPNTGFVAPVAAHPAVPLALAIEIVRSGM